MKKFTGNIMHLSILIGILVLTIKFSFCSARQFKEVDFEGELWLTNDPELEITEEGMSIKRGIAFPKGLRGEEGILTVEIKNLSTRSFPGLIFHLDPENLSYEELFLRVHKSGFPDALQYSPVFYGLTNWQLYPEYQSAYIFEKNQWQTLKVEFNENAAYVYLGESDVPLMSVLQLRKVGNSDFHLGIRTLGEVVFRNFKFEQKNIPPRLEIGKSIPVDGQIIQSYLISGLQSGNWPSIEIPDDSDFVYVETEPDGLLNVSAHVPKSVGNQFGQNPFEYVWLTFELISETDKVIALSFEYSDKVLIMKDGKCLFEGDNSFRQKGPLFRGEIDKNINSQRIFVDVKEGSNRFYIALGAKANGWGFMGKIHHGKN